MESKKRIPWNKGKKMDKPPWNKGLKGFKHSGSFKSGHEINKGKTWEWNEESKDNIKGRFKGIRRSIKTEIKPGQRIGKKTEFKKGQTPPNKFVDEKQVIKLYNDGLETKEISLLMHCNRGTVYQILNKFNINLRPSPTGENHPSWKGGKSFEPYDKQFTTIFKNSIRNRDNQVCQMCGVHREKLNEALSVHHINYDKYLCVKENCVSLCRKCHGITNTNREEWITFFHTLLTKKYNYIYVDGKIEVQICSAS